MPLAWWEERNRGVVIYQASHMVGRKEEGGGCDISGLSHGGKKGRGGRV